MADSAPMTTYPKGPKARAKIKTVLHEYKVGQLHSGSAKGPKVKSRSQAVAIALSEARTALGRRR